MDPGTLKKAIPRFASFKPNKASESQRHEIGPSQKTYGVSENHDNPPEASRSEFRDQGLGRCARQGHHEHTLGREWDRHIQSESTKQGPKTMSKLFTIDRVGDVKSIRFGADKYATASYFRSGAGSVVGLPRSQRIDRVVSTDKFLVLFDTDCMPKSRDRQASWRFHQKVARELKIKPGEEHSPIILSDYISLEDERSAKRRRGEDRAVVDYVSSSDEYDTYHRSVEGKAKSKKEPTHRDLGYNSDASSPPDITGSRMLEVDESTKEIRVELFRRLDAEPTNFEAWMDLIRHHDNMHGPGVDLKSSTKMTNAEKFSNSVIKLSIYEKALEKVTERQARQELLLGMMQEASKVWETDRILSCWKNILQQNPHSLRCWTKYLDFMQTNFSYFRFEEVQNAYLECLDMIQRARTSEEIAVDERESVFEIQVYVVLRMTSFIRESGFKEHATAAWQALLEFVFFKPTIVHNGDHSKKWSPDEATVSMFGEFWDSEVPRIGEEGATGWASFHQTQRKPPQPKFEVAVGLTKNEDHWKSWLASERRHSLLSRNPAHSIDILEEDDPYRIILFSDIRPFLFDPPSDASQQLILDAFVAFCCLPPLAAKGPDSRLRAWGRDGFLRNDALRSNRHLQDSWQLRSLQQNRSPGGQDSTEKQDCLLHSGTHDPFHFPLRDYQVSSDSLFGGKQWFSAFKTWEDQCFADDGPVDAGWVLRSLKSLIGVGVGSEAIALHALALELRTSPGTVKKAAKNYLRKRPFSIHLYNAYALIEYRLAGVKKGEDVIITSIKIGEKSDEISQGATILLWRTWIWETMSEDSAQEALVRLLAIGDEEIQMPSTKLKALDGSGLAKPAMLSRTERALVAIRDHTLSLSSYVQAAFAMECLMLLGYLSSASPLPAATSVFQTNIALLSTHVASTLSNHEYLHQSFARLLYYHSTHTHAFRPSDVRSILAESIAQFPHNTIFLSLYAWNEARFRIDDRLRSVIREVILAGSSDTGNVARDNVILHFFAVYSELQRAVTSGSNVSTIRSTFERALESHSGRHCAGLWKLYCLFEHSRYDAERARAIFWRGLRACPWAKDLFMLAFEHLRDDKTMDEADLRGIYKLLGEKELRVHVGLEDIFEGSDDL